MVLDVLKYFAKFPPKLAVQNMFSENSLNDESYTEMSDFVATLNNPILPLIEQFIFSQDETQIRNIVEKTDGFLMMVEYGAINGSGRNGVGVRDVDFNLSVIIARHFKQRKYDALTEAVIMDRCLEQLQTLITSMQADNEAEDACPFIGLADGGFDIAPLDPTGGVFGLYEAIGYVLSFKRSNNQFV